MPNTYKIQVITKDYVPELGHEYVDAQYFDVPLDTKIEDFIASKETEINAEKDSRIAARVYERQNPPVQKELSKEELMAIKAELLAQAEAQINELDVKIADAKLAKDIVVDGIAEVIK